MFQSGCTRGQIRLSDVSQMRVRSRHNCGAPKLQKSSCPTSFINDDCVRRTNKLLSFVIELDKGDAAEEAFDKY